MSNDLTGISPEMAVRPSIAFQYFGHVHSVLADPSAQERATHELLQPIAGCVSSAGKMQMPVVSVRLARGRSIEQKRAVVKAVTDAVVSSIDVKPEWVTVLIEEYERENWATGGELHSEKLGPSFGKQTK